MALRFPICAVLLTLPAAGYAARLTPPATRAFDDYIRTVESRLASPGPVAGALRVEPVNGGSWSVDGGRIHHWRAAALVPGATAEEMLGLLRDYDRLARHYAPEVVSSHALTNSGDRATLLMRFRKQRIVTVVLDAEFEAHSSMAGKRGRSASRSTHIWQIDGPGTPHERRRPEGADDGYLWRLNSYWNFEERPGGLYIECEAVSLTRDVPAGLGWLITPIIETLPRSSLEFTLTATKNALTLNASRRPNDDRAN